MHDGLAIVAVIFSNLAFMILILAWWRMRQRRIELQADLQGKLIDKFGSSPELISFLQSSAGRQFVHGVQTGATVITQERVLAGIRKSIILSFLGLGLLVISGISGADWVSWFGLIFLSLGIGYVVAAFVSRRLSRTDEEDVVPRTANSIP